MSLKGYDVKTTFVGEDGFVVRNYAIGKEAPGDSIGIVTESNCRYLAKEYARRVIERGLVFEYHDDMIAYWPPHSIKKVKVIPVYE